MKLHHLRHVGVTDRAWETESSGLTEYILVGTILGSRRALLILLESSSPCTPPLGGLRFPKISVVAIASTGIQRTALPGIC